MMGQRPTGIGRYTQQLIHHLINLNSPHEFLLYAPKGLFDRKRRLPNFDAPHVKLKPDFFNLGPAMTVNGTTVYHAPSLEDISKAPGKVIVTVHDLIYKTYPQAHTPQTIDLSQQYMQTIVDKASKIICISQSTRNDLHRFFDVKENKTCVIYNGVNHEVFHPLNSNDVTAGQQWLTTHGLNEAFILFVGTLEPRKNLRGVLHAMALLKAQGFMKIKLAIVGMQGWLSQGDDDLIKTLGLSDAVVFLGFITDSQLVLLYNKAKVFVFPSFYEGFGFPILEAMACGCPVVTSNTSSCQEVASNVAVTVDPHCHQAIADAIKKITEDEGLQNTMKQAGITHAAQFNFHQTAAATLAVYEDRYAAPC